MHGQRGRENFRVAWYGETVVVGAANDVDLEVTASSDCFYGVGWLPWEGGPCSVVIDNPSERWLCGGTADSVWVAALAAADRAVAPMTIRLAANFP